MLCRFQNIGSCHIDKPTIPLTRLYTTPCTFSSPWFELLCASEPSVAPVWLDLPLLAERVPGGSCQAAVGVNSGSPLVSAYIVAGLCARLCSTLPTSLLLLQIATLLMLHPFVRCCRLYCSENYLVGIFVCSQVMCVNRAVSLSPGCHERNFQVLLRPEACCQVVITTAKGSRLLTWNTSIEERLTAAVPFKFETACLPVQTIVCAIYRTTSQH